MLVRQKPGSARGVLFITIEDETGFANLIVWPSVFEQQRRLILNASMLACHGRLQREGGVVHVITDRIEDLSGLLRSVAGRDEGVPGQEGGRHGAGSDHQEALRGGIRPPTRDFR